MSRRAVRQRQTQRQQLNAPDLSTPLPATDEPVPAAPVVTDWPAIVSRHPGWWQVHRVELHGGERHYVLIAETRTEARAFEVAAHQVSQVRIAKWGSRERPYESLRPPRVVPAPEDPRRI